MGNVDSSFLSILPTLHDNLRDIGAVLAGDVDRNTRLVSATALALSHYREEGLALFPVVYIANDCAEFYKIGGGGSTHVMGAGDLSEEVVRLALKRCAPLATNALWAVFLLFEGDRLKYGVFRTQQTPVATTSFEALRSLRGNSHGIVGITRLGESVVEVRASDGRFRYLDYTGAGAGSGSPTEVLRSFFKAATADAPRELADPFGVFYYRVGIELLHSPRGTLAVVVPRGKAVPECLQDGVIFAEPMRIEVAMASYVQEHAEGATLALVSYLTLFRSMLYMDGITVLSSDGALLAYNCFVHERLRREPPRGLLGGARRRAYDFLCSRVGHELGAALYKSQDGPVESCVAKERS